ncbi:hypothetical protein BDZ89DRAFT_1082244 [Hymenopellis radicata]|nr:hypothetical protein BDZ89DRAFT_1082244 [Hymenopellis radicata]
MSNSSAYTPKRENETPPSPKPSPKLSPAQAISEAWKRESAESKERWRRLQEEAKRQYTNPRKRISRIPKL